MSHCRSKLLVVASVIGLAGGGGGVGSIAGLGCGESKGGIPATAGGGATGSAGHTGGAAGVAGVAGAGAAGGGSGGGGAAGTGPGGGAGGTAGITGAAILTVPFQRSGQAVDLTIAFGDASQNGGNAVVADLSAVTQVRFRLCVSGAPDPDNTTLQLAVTDAVRGTHAGAELPLSDVAVASCPTMKDVTLPVAGGTLDPTRVVSLSLTVGTSAKASSFAAPTVIDLDAVTVSGNAIGPYDFARNTVPLQLHDAQGVGAALRASAPDLSPTDSAPGVLVKLPPLTDTRLNFSTFGISLGAPVDFSAPGTVVTYRVCAVSAPQASALFVLHFLTDNHNKSAVTPMGSLAAVSACPVLSELTFAVADHASTDNSTVSFASVNLLGFEIGSQAMTQQPSVFFLDAIKVTSDIAGPFDFTFNAQSLIMGYRASGTALEWTSMPP